MQTKDIWQQHSIAITFYSSVTVFKTRPNHDILVVKDRHDHKSFKLAHERLPHLTVLFYERLLVADMGQIAFLSLFPCNDFALHNYIFIFFKNT